MKNGRLFNRPFSLVVNVQKHPSRGNGGGTPPIRSHVDPDEAEKRDLASKGTFLEGFIGLQ